MKKLKIILKIIGYFLVGTIGLTILFLVGLTIYDFIKMNQIESKVAQLKRGDSKEKVIQLLGKPLYTWKKTGPEEKSRSLPFWFHENSGMAYGKILDWENAISTHYPYFYPFKFRLFYPHKGDILIYLNENDQISKIETPKVHQLRSNLTLSACYFSVRLPTPPETIKCS